jgi:hypothetical protein
MRVARLTRQDARRFARFVSEFCVAPRACSLVGLFLVLWRRTARRVARAAAKTARAASADGDSGAAGDDDDGDDDDPLDQMAADGAAETAGGADNKHVAAMMNDAPFYRDWLLPK